MNRPDDTRQPDDIRQSDDARRSDDSRRIFRREDTPAQVDRNVAEEIEFHLAWRKEQLMARGLSEAEAEREARRRFGDADDVGGQLRRSGRRAVRRRHTGEALADLGRDIATAGRRLLRAPGFTAAVILSLALGIGLNATIFSFVNAILLRPLPVSDSDRLCSVHTENRGAVASVSLGQVSWPDYRDLKEMNTCFTSLAAHAYSPVALTTDATAEPGAGVLLAQMISDDFFATLGIEMALGRDFLPAENVTPGMNPVAIMSYDLWQDRFDGAPDVIGRTIHLNGRPFTVVGVVPEEFTGLSVLLQPALWTPLMMVGEIFPYRVNFEGRVDPWLSLIGRLSDGTTPGQAQVELDRVGAVLAETWPDLNTHKRFIALPAERTRLNHIQTTDRAAQLSGLLMAMVILVLGIAAFNAANLHLADAVRRRTEMAVRSSLGATRGRVVRNLLLESFLPALAAGCLGLLFALWASRVLWSLQPPIEVPLAIDLAPDVRIVGFTLLLTITAGLVFGLAPALTVFGRRSFDRLRVQTSPLARTRGTARLQRVLVAGQVAVSLLLLSVTGLFARSLQNTLAVESGFELERGLVLEVNLGLGEYSESTGRAYYRDIEEGLTAIPGVRGVAVAAALPLGQSHGHHHVAIEGYEQGPDEYMVFKRNMISGGYLETMGIEVVSGRGIDERDRADTLPVAVVNETMAGRYWADGDPVGRTIRADLGVARTVVGVIADGKYSTLNDDPEPYLCIPLSQAPWVQRRFAVAAVEGDPAAVADRVRAVTADLDPALPVPITTLSEYLSLSTGAQAFPLYMIGSFTLLALVLTLIGIYGVSARTVSQRTREFGLRAALGAGHGMIVREVLRQGLRTTLAGLVLGIAASIAAGQILQASLFGVTGLDPVLLVLLPLAILLLTGLAAVIPARWAVRVDPVDALRVE